MVAEFQAAMREHGLEPPSHIPPGQWVRFSTNGKRGDLSGWCSLRPDGEVGVFGDFRTSLRGVWHAKRARPRTAWEAAEHRRWVEQKLREHEEERGLKQAAAREAASEIWGKSEPASEEHPYLVRKGVKPHGVREFDGRLVIPVFDASGQLQTLEFIAADGTKRFLRDGKKAGGFYLLGEVKERLLIGEGFATVASLHEASGWPAAVAFDSGNLLSVTKALREQYPDAEIVIAADDDYKTEGNPGLAKANEAAQAVAGFVAAPDFGPNRPEGGKDFNDLRVHLGDEAVRASLAARRPPEASQAPAPSPTPSRVLESPPAPSEWPEPLPLVSEGFAPPFPIEALPGGIRSAIQEVQAFVQAPTPLVVNSALAALSLAAQGLADVRRAEGLVGPCSLFLLSIADSGERKSSCDSQFTEGIRQWEAEQAELMRPEVIRFSAGLKAWEARREGLLQKIKSLSAKNQPSDGEGRELAELEEDKPRAPLVPRLLYADATPEALAHALATGWHSAAVISSEAGIVLGGHGMKSDSMLRNLALLNTLWDGGVQTVDRRQAGSFTLRGARLTVALAAQPDAVFSFVEATKGLARGTGFLARFLVAWPQSTQGSRTYREAPKAWPHKSAFQRRLLELLAMPVSASESGELNPPVLDLTPEAKAEWVLFYDDVERELRTGGEMESARDVASKAADNLARLAGLFHIFRVGPQGAIGREDMQAAATIVEWFLLEARRFLGTLALPPQMLGASKLDAWLLARCRETKTDSVATRDVLRGGPGALRDLGVLEEAVAELAKNGRARIVQQGKQRRIYLNPELLTGGDDVGR